MTKNESTQPQLPQRPRRVEDGNGNKTHYTANDVDAYMNALEAENESLKARLERTTDSYRHLPACNYWTEPVGFPGCICSPVSKAELTALEKENESLKAERDKMLDVLRKYRFGHAHGTWGCPTCIKADALLSREIQEGQNG